MNNSPFSMGWLMTMFDFPVMTPEERRTATQFRKDLLDHGFLMIQFWGEAKTQPARVIFSL